jgi:hypothetical protein
LHRKLKTKGGLDGKNLVLASRVKGLSPILSGQKRVRNDPFALPLFAALGNRLFGEMAGLKAPIFLA